MIKKLLKIKKIIEYIQLLWNDEDYEPSYLLYLIKYKINRMKNCIDNNSIIVQAEIDVIKEEVDTVTKLIDDYYNYDEIFEKEYGDIYEALDVERKLIGNEFVLVYKNTNNKISNRHSAKISNSIKKQLKLEEDLWCNIWDSLKKSHSWGD